MAKSHRFQAPKGMRDFPPGDLAIRRFIEGVWRDASIRHGFDEVEGPTFEHLELYTAKSGPGIVSELFSFKRAGGDTDYALRPEFTPTVARMVASLGSSAPKPIKWFGMPVLFRAERPQRGRLREHVQWNLDVFGDATPTADAEVIAVAVDAFSRLGLTPKDVCIRISHRDLMRDLLLRRLELEEASLDSAFQLLDRRAKMKPDVFADEAAKLGITGEHATLVDAFCDSAVPLDAIDSAAQTLAGGDAALALILAASEGLSTLDALKTALDDAGVTDWCTIDASIVRGLAYYTGTVFEVHEVTGRERAIAGGGRYDTLVERFGGQPTPAIGFGMGDVVLKLVLEDRGLLPPASELMPRPDAFVLGDDATVLHRKDHLLAELRARGLHARRSYKATTKVRKWLEEAAKAGARWAILIDGDDDATVQIRSVGESRHGDVDERVADADVADWIRSHAASS